MIDADETATAERRVEGADAHLDASGPGERGEGEGEAEDPSEKPQEPIAPDERGD